MIFADLHPPLDGEATESLSLSFSACSPYIQSFGIGFHCLSPFDAK